MEQSSAKLSDCCILEMTSCKEGEWVRISLTQGHNLWGIHVQQSKVIHERPK